MPVSLLALGESLWDFGERVIQDGDQVDWMAPFVGFFHALPVRERGQQAGEGDFCCVPPGPIERLERFVGEIQDVTAVQVAVIRRSRSEEHTSELQSLTNLV